jgi:MFS family permease
MSSLFGVLYFLLTIITLFWGTYVGTVVDRYDRKKIFIWINVFGAAGLFVSAFLCSTLDSVPWFIAIIPFYVTALIYNIHFPNLYSFAQEITETEHYGKITSILEIQGQLAFAISGALASLLLVGSTNQQINVAGFSFQLSKDFAPWSLGSIFLLNGFTYVSSLIFTYFIQFERVAERHIDQGTVWDRLMMGFNFLKSNKKLLYFGVFSLFVFATILVCSTYLMPIYVNNHLKATGDVYAGSEMYFALGSLLAGFLTAKAFSNPNVYIRVIILLSFVATAIYLILFATNNIPIFYFMHALLGFANASIRILRVTYLFRNTPNSVIGRTNSVYFMSNVFWRLIWIGIISIPFFSIGNNIVYICFGLGIFTFIGGLGVWYAQRIDTATIEV